MFDRYIVQPQRVTERVTVEKHEHRAPTDESVRLLSEMEKAAKDKIIEAIDVSDNQFSAVVHIMQDMLSRRTLAECVFSMNGKKVTAKVSIPSSSSAKLGSDPKRELATAIRDEVAKEIASLLVFDAMMKADR